MVNINKKFTLKSKHNPYPVTRKNRIRFYSDGVDLETHNLIEELHSVDIDVVQDSNALNFELIIKDDDDTIEGEKFVFNPSNPNLNTHNFYIKKDSGQKEHKLYIYLNAPTHVKFVDLIDIKLRSKSLDEEIWFEPDDNLFVYKDGVWVLKKDFDMKSNEEEVYRFEIDIVPQEYTTTWNREIEETFELSITVLDYYNFGPDASDTDTKTITSNIKINGIQKGMDKIFTMDHIESYGGLKLYPIKDIYTIKEFAPYMWFLTFNTNVRTKLCAYVLDANGKEVEFDYGIENPYIQYIHLFIGDKYKKITSEDVIPLNPDDKSVNSIKLLLNEFFEGVNKSRDIILKFIDVLDGEVVKTVHIRQESGLAENKLTLFETIGKLRMEDNAEELQYKLEDYLFDGIEMDNEIMAWYLRNKGVVLGCNTRIVNNEIVLDKDTIKAILIKKEN